MAIHLSPIAAIRYDCRACLAFVAMDCMKFSSMGLRCGVLLAFLVGMPLLALPPIADNIGSLPQLLFQSASPRFEIAQVKASPREQETAAAAGVNLVAPKTAFETHEKPTVQQVSVETPVSATQHRDVVLNQRIAEVSNRLKRFGGTDCALEQVDAPEPRYRFACKVPLADNSPYSRPFEAVERDPYVAMNRVLMRVEGWRNAQAGGGKILR